jgi:hypothetical protein
MNPDTTPTKTKSLAYFIDPPLPSARNKTLLKEPLPGPLVSNMGTIAPPD